MVFMKKGATPNKNQQQLKKGKATPSKKVQEDFEEVDDSGDDVDSDEAPQLQKTPLNKGAKGRQSMSEKKVSFSIPGKNSPGVKTPKKDNSILAKKQPTPASKGKTSMQEFKGMKAQADDDDDEEDDDDEDDDDFEVDDIEMVMGGDDDEEEDDDEDDEDDDEEDDDDEEEDEDGEEVTMKKKVAIVKEKSPKKDKSKEAVKDTQEKPAVDDKLKGEILKDENERRKERNARMLYIGKLPNDVTEQELKVLSKDIVEVSVPMGNRKHQSKTVYAFVTFDTEAKAEANYKSLQTKKFRGQPLTVDYVGEKSAHGKSTEESKQGLNLKRLFVTGLPLDATLSDVAKHFKKAFQISFNICPTSRTATICFLTEEDAKAAYDASRDISVGGLKLTVIYSRQGGAAPQISKRKNRGKRSHKGNQNGGQQTAKKMKLSN